MLAIALQPLRREEYDVRNKIGNLKYSLSGGPLLNDSDEYISLLKIELSVLEAYKAVLLRRIQILAEALDDTGTPENPNPDQLRDQRAF